MPFLLKLLTLMSMMLLLVPLQEDKEHQHDTSVSSVGIEMEGTCSIRKLNNWLSKLLSEKGADLYRSKGVLSVEGSDDR